MMHALNILLERPSHDIDVTLTVENGNDGRDENGEVSDNQLQHWYLISIDSLYHS